MTTTLLELTDLCKRYRRGPLVNDHISLTVNAGEIFGLLGPNGAGKTTLVRQIMGLARPTSGTITLDGADVVSHPEVARQGCSMQPQTRVGIEGLTPAQSIELVGRMRGGERAAVRARARQLLDRLEIGDFIDRPSDENSGGVARLVAFCMAAVSPGRLLVLDEPTNDVDPLRRRLLWDLIREIADSGIAVLLVTHNVLEAEQAVDHLAILDNGKVIAAGSVATVAAATGTDLRLELSVRPDAEPPAIPSYATSLGQRGRRLVLRVPVLDASRALTWVQSLREAGTAEQFTLGPVTLEDAYLLHVNAKEIVNA